MVLRSNIRPSKLKLDERSFVRARGETNDQVIRRVAEELRRFSFYGRTDLVGKIAAHPLLPVELMSIYGKAVKFHGTRLQLSDISKNSYPQWIISMFIRNKKLLHDFLRLRERINAQVLKGRGSEALTLLKELTQLSESWWGIDTKIHITKEILGQDTKILVNEIRERYPKLNLSLISNDLLLLSESSSVDLYYGRVLERIKEYKNADIDGSSVYGDLESMSLLPLYYDPTRSPKLEVLHRYMDWSLIDQYMLFRQIIMENEKPAELLGEKFGEASILAEILGDWELQNSLRLNIQTNAFVDSVIAHYTRGEYKDVVRKIIEAVHAERREVYSLIDIYARAKIYSEDAATIETFYDKLANEMGKALTLDQKSRERIEYLHSITIKFRKEPWAKSLLYHLVASQEYKIDPALVEVARKQVTCLGDLNTPKARTSHFNVSDLIKNFAGNIPRYRLIRHNKMQIGEAVEPSLFPIYSDFLKTQCESYLSKDFFWKTVDFCIGEYLKNRVAFDYLPFKQICQRIESIDRDNKSDFDYLSAIVAVDICERELEGEGVESLDELRTDIFLEYLAGKKSNTPSRIFTDSKFNGRQAYFLKNICLPAQLDNIIQFDSVDEVIHERVAIIDMLIAKRDVDVETLIAERDKVLETLFSEKLRAKIDAGKLYVDVQALETDRRHVYLDFYKRAKALGSDLIWEPIDHIPGAFEEGSHQTDADGAKGSGEKSTILVTLFMTMSHDFALSQKYGLDKYLSAEVRHQIFIPKLRACFERNNLVTVQKYGQYLANDFWITEYNYVSNEAIEKLNKILRVFSQKIDESLSKVNESFKVWTIGSHSSELFDFSPTSERLSRVAGIVNKSTNFESFFNEFIGFMLELAVEGGRSAQHLINETLMPEVLAYLDELESDINSWKGNAPLFNLMQSIRSARSEFIKEIEVVLLWFRVVGSESLQSFEALGTVIEAAVSSFQAIFEHKQKTLAYNPAKGELILNYREARSLFISLFTALDNSLRYGANDSQVTIDHQTSEQRDCVNISNVAAQKMVDPQEFIRLRREEWTNELSQLNNQEGGTGLYKIYNLLTGSSPGFSFDISISNLTFNASIGLNHEYFSDRRQPT